MNSLKTILIAAAIVFAFAVLGALISGDPNTGPYSAMLQPKIAPPLWGWLTIASLYYTGAVVIITRLWNGKGAALAAILLVLLSNELWNVFLFQMGRADYAFYALLPFAALVIVAQRLCMRRDRLLGVFMILYGLWVIFDLVWAWQLMGLNP